MSSRLGIISGYSLLWGVLKLEDLFEKLATLHTTVAAITDRDSLCGYPACREEAQKWGISLHCSALLTEGEKEIYAFVQNQQGYERLCLLLTKRHHDSTYSYLGDLLENAEGLALATTDKEILTTLAHHVPLLYGAVTPFFLGCIATARSLKVPLLAVDDAFLLTEEQRAIHKVLRAIALKKTLGTLSEEEYRSHGGLLLDQQQWEASFSCWDEAVREASLLKPYDPFSKGHIFPSYRPENGITDAQELRNRVFIGAERRYGELNDAIIDRIEYELTIIQEKGFAPYFLVMHDIVQMSSRTCGRGSAAASIVSYSLYITNVDPIAHHLYFERFLSPSRLDPPDIDVDFAWDERDGVFAQVFARFGLEHCARVANHNKFRLRSALRETARCHGLTDTQITKAENELFFKEKGSLTDPLWQDIITIATQLEGLPKELSMHCGGLIITSRALYNHAPVLHSAQGYPLLCWEKEGAEAAGFVKIDLLGNRSLAVIRDTLANLAEEGLFINERTWHPQEDAKTRESLALGDTMGVFYIESPAMRQLQKKTNKGDFEHIIIHSSIIRPAANAYIAEYVQRLKGKKWQPLHPRLSYILDETYGILCYQEDVSKTAVALAGFSEADADNLRKIIAKKTAHQRLKVYKEQFFTGCRKNKVTEPVIEEIWQMMLSFDGYSFCKPHSASYAMVSFQSAYLRTHHGPYFMASVLTNQGGYYRPDAYISEARRMGITIIGPDINKSRVTYHAQGNSLIVGFMAIANLTSQGSQKIVVQRHKEGPFSSLREAALRLSLSRDDYNALVAAGAFDSLAPQYRRSEQLKILLTTGFSDKNEMQAELFQFTAKVPASKTVAVRTSTTEDELLREFSALGFLRDHHPLVLFKRHLQGCARIMACDMKLYEGRYVTLVGYPITQKQVLTKGGQSMSFVSFEDETALYETVLFPLLFEKYYPLLSSRWPLWVSGVIQNDQGALIVEVQHLLKVGS
jgi:DNA polymerase-3 subunit alpha/error-prone DNA polymerase